MTKLNVISAVSKAQTQAALTTAARITPMTDITELALLVSKAKASVFTLEYISQFEPADIDSDDVDLRFEVDGRDTGTNVSIVDECGQAAKVIGTLVEALEKAQRANAAQDDHINQQQDRIDQLEKGHQEAAKQINSWRRMAKQNIAEREKDIAELDAARQRIAELESRTVIVKLPQPISVLHRRDFTDAHRAIYAYPEAEVNAALASAGIKVEAE
ncbi:ead/Ea22-like family protein [Klebsiella pneumoniae]|nr:ead/Ea22-like family protein [Klebsiella pneumoniae]MDF9925155.1 ead/Ea22-like family protein [Klebsiella pneumoniae]